MTLKDFRWGSFRFGLILFTTLLVVHLNLLGWNLWKGRDISANTFSIGLCAIALYVVGGLEEQFRAMLAKRLSDAMISKKMEEAILRHGIGADEIEEVEVVVKGPTH